MALMTPEVNGARQELPCLESPEIDGARQEVAAVEKYVDGAWQEVWSNGIPPDGIYLTSKSFYNQGVAAYIDGGTICLNGAYIATADTVSRVVIFVESDELPLITIDEITCHGYSGLTSGTVTIIASTMAYNPKSNARSGADSATLFTASILEETTEKNLSWQATKERSDGYYVMLDTYVTVNASGFDSGLVFSQIPVIIQGLRINGQRIAGDMVGVYES